MAISVLDLFKIGIGPSSSHTVGPMRAARTFVQGLADAGRLEQTSAVRAQLFGSLGATGRGHGSDRAVILGLLGETPEGVAVEAIGDLVAAVRQSGRLRLLNRHDVVFRESDHLTFERTTLPFHPNGMRFTATGPDDQVLSTRVYYSVGGGFVVDEDAAAGANPIKADATPQAFPFSTAVTLLQHCRATGFPISRIMLENEKAFRPEVETRAALLRLWTVMQECVRHGMSAEGVLPGGLKVRRRARDLHRSLLENPEAGLRDPLTAIDWVNLYALAVNEENAAGGRVVTAPTNGAAGIIPAVLHYYARFVPGANDEGIGRFLLTAGAIGVLYK
ncbi:MAG TPA: L-serine ammonia-lyase, partial [Vicinamibacteria bacterium]|nr:L-serine ammonia-lyase [Vicinamibacteria bacterium]